MPKNSLNLQRAVSLVVLVAVFIFTYTADLDLFAVVIKTFSLASPYLEHFIMLFLILSFTGLCVYYYLTKMSNAHISQRILAWVRVLSWSFFTAFLVSCLVFYSNIYFDKTFDI